MARKHFDYEKRKLENPVSIKGRKFTHEIIRVQATEIEGPGAHVFYFMSEDEADECLESL